jgi:exonuclease III
VQIKIIHLNIERDKHIETVTKFFDSEKADIICLCEVAESSAQKWAKMFGYEFVFSALFNSSDGKYGSAILSKKSILESSNLRYDEEISNNLPFITFNNDYKNTDYKRPKDRFLYHYAVLTITVENDKGKKITISTTHFPVTDHFSPGLPDHVYNEPSDIEELNHTRVLFDKFMSLIKNISNPIIFTADINNPRGEYVYDTLAHELIDLTPQDVVSTIDPDLHYRKGLSLVVDTIMISPDVQAEKVNVISGVSDHKAIIALLDV